MKTVRHARGRERERGRDLMTRRHADPGKQTREMWTTTGKRHRLSRVPVRNRLPILIRGTRGSGVCCCRCRQRVTATTAPDQRFRKKRANCSLLSQINCRDHGTGRAAAGASSRQRLVAAIRTRGTQKASERCAIKSLTHQVNCHGSRSLARSLTDRQTRRTCTHSLR